MIDLPIRVVQQYSSALAAMLKLFIERLALISALSALVLAVFWPHAGPKLTEKFENFILALSRSWIDAESLNNVQDEGGPKERKRVIDEHPRLSGRSLRRLVSGTEVS